MSAKSLDTRSRKKKTSARITAEQVVAFLNKHDPAQKLGKELFEAIARVVVCVAVEAVSLRRHAKTKKIEVFLTFRGPQESYAGMWHTPGSIFRPGEQAQDVIKRLGKREFKTRVTSDYHCVYDYFFQEERGWWLSRIYLVNLRGRPTVAGRWWPVDKLPKNIVWHHRDIVIPQAVKAFVTKK